MLNQYTPLSALLISGLAATASAATSGSETSPSPVLTLTDQEAAAPAATGSTEGLVINTYFKDGLRFSTPDKSFTLKIGARITYDVSFLSTNNEWERTYGNEVDGAGFRMARISAEGTFNQFVEYKYVYDMAGGTNNKFKDVYIGFTKLCCGNGGVRIGQFKEPMGLEQLTSSANLTFVERGASDALIPGRNTGIMWYDACNSGRTNYAFGIFRDDGSDTGNDTGTGDYSFTARVSGTPVKSDDTHLLHLGLSGRRREHSLGDNFTLTYSGESRTSKSGDLASLDLGSVDHSDTVGVEAAWMGGPLSFQAEYVNSHFDVEQGAGTTAEGWYVYGSMFLTDGHRNYEAKKGAFGRVKPSRPKAVDGGMGALEAALRFSRLDLNDQGPTVVGTNGGAVDAVTAGLNWYLNDFTRVMCDYMRVYPHDDSSGTPVADVFQVRLQIDI